jgi:hypothetical protein
MRRFALAFLAVIGVLSFGTFEAKAVICARGVYRAGCAGPDGAVMVRRPPYYSYHRQSGSISCASGVYRAGCIGPHGAVVARRPY